MKWILSVAGALIPIRMINSLDTSKSKTGYLFTGTLDFTLVGGGAIVAPKGPTVHGRASNFENAGRATGKSDLQIGLIDIVINGAAQPISNRSNRWHV